MNNRYRAIIRAFKDKGVLIIGDLILDSYIFGRVNRVSPEAPVPVVEVTEEAYRLGGAANVANNIAALGGRVTLAGIIGNDSGGEVLKTLCNDKGISTEGFITEDRPTTVKTRIVAHQQQITRIDREDPSPLSKSVASRLLTFIKRNISYYDGIIISDYKKGVVDETLVRTVVRNAQGRFLSLDPKTGNFHCYKGVSLITPNLKEASEGSGIDIRDEATLNKAAQSLIKRLSLKSLLITRGEEGMSLFERDPEGKDITMSHIPATARKVFDVTGAGDTVIAVMTLAHVSGGSLREAAIMANCAAGMVVAEVGTATVSPEGLLQSLCATAGKTNLTCRRAPD